MDIRYVVLAPALLCASLPSAFACDVAQLADSFRQCWQSGTASVRTCETTKSFWGNEKYTCHLRELSRNDTITLLKKAAASQNLSRIKSAYRACNAGANEQAIALIEDSSCSTILLHRAIRHAMQCYQPKADSPRSLKAECESP